MTRGLPHDSRPRPWVKICGVTRLEDAQAAVEVGADLVGLNFWSRSPRHVAADAAREIAAAVRGRVTLVGVFVNDDPERIESLCGELGLDLVQLHGDEPESAQALFANRLVRVVRANGLERPASLSRSSRDGAVRERDDGRARASARERPPVTGEDGPAGVPEGASAASTGSRGSELKLEHDVEPLASAAPAPMPDETGVAASSKRGLFLPQQDLASLNPGARRRQHSGTMHPRFYLIDAPKDARFGGTGRAWAWERAREWIAACPRPVLVAGGIRPGVAAAALATSGAAGVDVASGVESSPGVKDAEKMRRLIEEVRS